jgi:CRISPR-associated protein Cas2
MARTRYIVSYDVADPKRLRKVARILEGYGTRIQFSVFECPLDDLKLSSLNADLHGEINHDADQILFITLGPESGNSIFRINSMGLPYTKKTRITVI